MSTPTAWAPFSSTLGASVPTRALLSALMIPHALDGMTIFCQEAGFQQPYVFSLTSGATINGTTVLATTIGGASRWLSQSVSPSSINLRGTFAARPAPATAGRLYFATDTLEVYYDTGAAWVGHEHSLPLTPPPLVSALTWINQGAATAFDEGDTLRVTKPETGANVNSRGLLVEVTPATPWTWTCAFRAQFAPTATMLGGLVLYETATTRLIEYALYYAANAVHLELSRLASPTAVAGVPYRDTIAGIECIATGLQYFQITDEGPGGNLVFRYSTDGLYFQRFEQRARVDFFAVGPDRRGVLVDNITPAVGLDEATLRVKSWL